MQNPVLSIICITYNHGKYIRQALESFVTQKTDFPFEVIVADDFSTDNARDIIREYEQKYPEIIKPIWRDKNVGISANNNEAFSRATGKYIALCEGDDFFTDKNKIQMQADFLEKNSDYSMCFHPVRCFWENGEKADEIFPEVNGRPYTLTELLKGNFIQTNSAVYRRKPYDSLPENILPMDWYIHLYHAKDGKIGFINKTMSAYRKHSGGIWADAAHDIEKHYKRHGVVQLAMFFEVLKLFKDSPEYREIVMGGILYLLDSFCRIDKKENTDLLEKSLLRADIDVLRLIVTELCCHTGNQASSAVSDAVSSAQLARILSSRKWRFISMIEKKTPSGLIRFIKKRWR